MRALITISSCARDVLGGYNQSLRDTWLKEIAGIPWLDYKFFIGSGRWDGKGLGNGFHFHWAATGVGMRRHPIMSMMRQPQSTCR